MRNVFGAVVVATVCGVCCASPLALPALRNVASSVAAALGWQTAAVAGAVAVAVMVQFVHWRTRRCKSPASRLEVRRDMREPPACTLPSPRMVEGAAAIAGLARRGLLAHQQCGPSLYLRYSSSVACELEPLVEQERECCPFLDFELTDQGDAVHLIITAARGSGQVRTDLTSHFLGKPAPQRACAPSCGCNPQASSAKAGLPG